MDKKLKYKLGIRSAAFFTLLFFGFSQTFSSAATPFSVSPSKSAAKIKIENPAPVQSLVDILSDIPSELGSISENALGRNVENGPVVLHIQDAHSNLDAQTKIFHILEYLAKKVPALKIAVEGAEGELHPEYFDFFPEVPQAGEAVVQDLLEKGELTGAELFAWKQYKKHPVSVYGAEDQKLYRENLTAYRKLLLTRDERKPALDELRKGLMLRQSQVVNPKLRNFLKERDQRRNGRYGSEKTEGEFDLSGYLAYLKEEIQKCLQIDLNDPIEQLRFPNLVRLLKIQQAERKFDAAKAGEDWKKVVALLSEKAKGEQEKSLVQRLDVFGRKNGLIYAEGPQKKAGQQTSIYPRQLLERIYLYATARKVDLSGFKQFFESFKLLIFQAEIDLTDMTKEMDFLEKGLLEKLAGTPEEKQLVRDLENFDLLEKLLQLELTGPEYDQALAQKSELQQVAGEKIKGAVEQAYGFYKVARERDEVLIDNALRATGREPRATLTVLISGGFHTEGIGQQLEQRRIPYAVLQPRINQMDNGETYEKVMADANADLTMYFKQKNPFETKQQAILFKELIEIAAPEARKNTNVESPTFLKELNETLSHHSVLSQTLTSQLYDRAAEPFIRVFPKTAFMTKSAIVAPLLSAESSSEIENQPSIPPSTLRLIDKGNVLAAKLEEVARTTTAGGVTIETGVMPMRIEPTQRSEARSDAQEVKMQGVPVAASQVVMGRLRIWTPGDDPRKINRTFVRPYDDVKMIGDRINMEIQALQDSLNALLGKLQTELHGEKTEAVLRHIHEIAARTEAVIREQHLKVEFALKDEALVKAKSRLTGGGDDDEDLRSAMTIMEGRLLPALEARTELLLDPELKTDERGKQFIEREKMKFIVAAHAIVLGLSYGWHLTTEGMNEDEITQTRSAQELTKGMSLVSAQMILRARDLTGPILKKIESGMRPSVAIDTFIAEKLNPLLQMLNQGIEQLERQQRETGKDNTAAIESREKMRDTPKKGITLLEKIKKEMSIFNFAYENSDIDKDEKVREEVQRFYQLMALNRPYFVGNTASEFAAFLSRFEQNVLHEIQVRKRRLEYAIAKAYYLERQFLIQAAQAPNPDSVPFPPVHFDFITRAYYLALYGMPVRKSTESIIVLAPEGVSNEQEEAQMLGEVAAEGNIVGIVTLAGTGAVGRFSHVMMNARKRGIVGIDAAKFLNRKGLSNVRGPDVNAILDGKSGSVTINPSPRTIRRMKERAEDLSYLDGFYKSRASLPAPISFLADESRISYVERRAHALDPLSALGARGIGLFRLEDIMLAAGQGTSLQDDEQALTLAILEFLNQPVFRDPNTPLIIRLFDVQEDKRPDFLVKYFEAQGWTKDQIDKFVSDYANVRFYLQQDKSNPIFYQMREFGKRQLRALIKAFLTSNRPNLRILFSNVQTPDEVKEIRKLIAEAKKEVAYELWNGQKVRTTLHEIRERELIKGEELDALTRGAEQAGYEWLEIQILQKAETNPALKKLIPAEHNYEDELKQTSRRLSAQLRPLRFGFMFEEITAVGARDKIMGEIVSNGYKDEKPFVASGTNDLQKSVLIAQNTIDDFNIANLHPVTVSGLLNLEASARTRGLDFTIEGEWGGSYQMLFTALALQRYKGISLQLVATTEKIPELLELSRNVTDTDLEFKFDLGDQYGPASLKDLVERIVAGRIPTVEEFNLVLEKLLDRIENKILGNADRVTDYQNFKTREQVLQLQHPVRSEARIAIANPIAPTPTSVYKQNLPAVRNFRIDAPNFPENTIREIAEELGVVFSVENVGLYLPGEVRVAGYEDAEILNRNQAAQLWVIAALLRTTVEVAAEAGIENQNLKALLAPFIGSLNLGPQDPTIPGQPIQKVHVQLPSLNKEALNQLIDQLPILLAVLVETRSSLALDIDPNTLKQAEIDPADFYARVEELARENGVNLRPDQFSVVPTKGKAFSSLSAVKMNGEQHSLVGRENTYKGIPLRPGIESRWGVPQDEINPANWIAHTLVAIADLLKNQAPDRYAIRYANQEQPEMFGLALSLVTQYLNQAKTRISA